jgi:hypothetical protein
MHAAVVRSFDAPPRYETFPTPQPSGEHEIAVDVLAAGLHPRVRSGASGSHYTSTEALPLIPGIDGVGRSADGQMLYFVAFDSAFGTMAERTVIDRRRAVVLADNANVPAIAAGMNPGMSSWVALRKRISFEPGQKVLVLGATGNAGQMAVQIAKFLGAGNVAAAGRDPERLARLTSLGADQDRLTRRRARRGHAWARIGGRGCGRRGRLLVGRGERAGDSSARREPRGAQQAAVVDPDRRDRRWTSARSPARPRNPGDCRNPARGSGRAARRRPRARSAARPWP